jgi:hypothetical protein
MAGTIFVPRGLAYAFSGGACYGLACRGSPRAGANVMFERNWEREVHENLAKEARLEASILHNPRLARRYIERGAAIALVVVLTYCASGMKGFDAGQRSLFFTCSIACAAISAFLVTLGLYGLAGQRLRQPTRPPRDHEHPPIGW